MEIETLIAIKKKSRNEYHCGTKSEWKIYQLVKVAVITRALYAISVICVVDISSEIRLY